MAVYAIGDIQGCYDALLRLLDKLKFSGDDQLWVAGDLVNRGPQSLETLRFLKQMDSQVQCVLGNHDLHLLAVYHNRDHSKRKDTLDPILHSHDNDELMAWLQQLPLLVTDAEGQYCMTHAGLPPCWSIAEAQALANEVETVLRSDQAQTYFDAMYGNDPACWHPDLEGPTRWRVITNYLTRMRFCKADGTLNFSHKGPAGDMPEGFSPWYLFPRKSPADDKVNLIFGHWASLMGQVEQPHLFALDTGCVWGHQLTALRLDDHRIISVDGLSHTDRAE
ncbi:symmetrical bis(5'-nucleosyl)-tetraphosphatase [Neptuniibacter sp. CAU 1671]|uniref:symmetrical bis(5'-nucleosyl)-tetraphosphatase n=1 Tax=Neptuniibacter sp. CAU 1671 TaxID=3032593 RepID=UPI0023DB5643|nr:symmetrical bis(5'-nucleosyl)-tetraphosphatase [Neptuniibacter sp. CAU 1671]MDF2181431.1 symmetrical bis(5'-nucleosyl)-tetraphosphatase [Neptuniibacter sp. CAU 1671]